MKVMFVAIFGLLLLGCTSALNSDASTESIDRFTVLVGPQKVDCVGVGPMKCLVVDGELFYQPIQGFQFEPGYQYQLIIERKQVYTVSNVPADASLYQYKMIKVVTVKKVKIQK